MESNISRVRIDSPTRLHFSLIDMNGTVSGRVDGGAGLTISDPVVSLIAQHRFENTIAINITATASGGQIDTEFSDEIKAALLRVQDHYGLGGANIEIEHAIPAHSGFGSKTQTLLAAASAYCRLYDVLATPREVAALIGRGGTSGIGVAAFQSGGFIVDCGHAFQSKNRSYWPSSASRSLSPAPLVARYDFPEWPVLIVTPRGKKIHGAEEQRLFDEVCPIPLADAQACSHIVLMMLIPSVIEADLRTFCKGISLLQQLTWKRFEIQAQLPVVTDVMRLLSELGLEGVGMSSWGTTVFAFGPLLENEELTKNTLRQVQLLLNATGGGLCYITRANNTGARIEAVCVD